MVRAKFRFKCALRAARLIWVLILFRLYSSLSEDVCIAGLSPILIRSRRQLTVASLHYCVAIVSVMEDDLPLKPDTPWGTEVRTLMREQDQGFDDAFAQVMEKYFSRGHARPLVDLLVRGRVEPGERALRVCPEISRGIA
jgi:hypothetical protein